MRLWITAGSSWKKGIRNRKAPGERGNGYASWMLSKVLAFARSLGLERVMLDCDADNTASLKTILKCGGVFDRDTISDYQGKKIRNRHFWISLT
ncbi:GNAT family N-acetyltransferase [Eisenbergiella sp.]|uniref:GNAT family N-acetyltransferase n=1 Tax=Eisenbergiella sp. TaxID=1924109 RepID=UPI002F400F3D